jgi:RNA polymerase sigma-70 factor (ECF subfamily)
LLSAPASTGGGSWLLPARYRSDRDMNCKRTVARSSPQCGWGRQRGILTRVEAAVEGRGAGHQRSADHDRRRLAVGDDPDPDPELLGKLERAIVTLPRSTREIFLAHRLDDMSYHEIADRTGLTVRQVERHIARAIYRLCKELDDEPRPWWERWLGP